jgi:DNA-directed RNA polymerase subunit beta
MAEDIFDAKTGQVIFEAGHEMTADDLAWIEERYTIKTLPVLAIDHINVGPYIRNTMMIDKCDTVKTR